MSTSSEEAWEFTRGLMALAERLAKRNLVVASLRCDWDTFGSWVLEVQNGQAADAYRDALLKKNWDVPGPDALRFTWDGRDKQVTVHAASTEPLSSPGPWKLAKNADLKNSEAAIQFVERYVNGSA